MAFLARELQIKFGRSIRLEQSFLIPKYKHQTKLALKLLSSAAFPVFCSVTFAGVVLIFMRGELGQQH